MLSVISLVGYGYLMGVNKAAAFFLMPARFWELGLGCMTFLLVSGDKIPKRIATHKGWIAPISAVAIVVVLSLSGPSRALSTMTIALLTGLLLWAFERETWLAKLFSTRWLTQIGLLSYSLYLWHWSVLTLSYWTVGISWWTLPIQLGAIVAAAAASYYWVEKPLRRAQWSTTKIKTIGYGAATTLASGLCLLGLNKPLKGQLYTGQDFPEQSTVSFKASDSFQHCRSADRSSADFSDCAYPSVATEGADAQTLYFVGDSHNRSLKALASRMVERSDVSRVAMVARLECILTTKLVKNTPTKFVGPECLASNQGLLANLMDNGQPGDVVMLTVRFLPYFFEPNYEGDRSYWKEGGFSLTLDGEGLSAGQALPIYTQELVEIADQLSTKGMKLGSFCE